MGRLFHCHCGVRRLGGLFLAAAALASPEVRGQGGTRNEDEGRPFGSVGRDRPFGSLGNRPFGSLSDRPFGKVGQDRPFGSLSDRPLGDLGRDRPFSPLGGLDSVTFPPPPEPPFRPPSGGDLRPLVVWDYERGYPPEVFELPPVEVSFHALERMPSPAPVLAADWSVLPPGPERWALALEAEARAALRRGDYRQAEALGRRSFEVGGRGEEVRGLALFALGRHDVAAPLLLAAAASPRFHPEAWFASAHEFDARLAELAEALAGAPGESNALLAEGALAVAVQRLETAVLDLHTLEQFAAEDPRVAQLRELVVEALSADSLR